MTEGDKLNVSLQVKSTTPIKNPEIYIDVWFRREDLSNIGGWAPNINYNNGDVGSWFNPTGTYQLHSLPQITVPADAMYMGLEITVDHGAFEEPLGHVDIGEVIVGLSGG